MSFIVRRFMTSIESKLKACKSYEPNSSNLTIMINHAGLQQLAYEAEKDPSNCENIEFYGFPVFVYEDHDPEPRFKICKVLESGVCYDPTKKEQQ